LALLGGKPALDGQTVLHPAYSLNPLDEHLRQLLEMVAGDRAVEDNPVLVHIASDKVERRIA
jgi:hypothetical protein